MIEADWHNIKTMIAMEISQIPVAFRLFWISCFNLTLTVVQTKMWARRKFVITDIWMWNFSQKWPRNKVSES